MKIFNFGTRKTNSITRSGKTRAEAEAQRREEFEYRTKMSEIRRMASQMQRSTERARAEAYRLEMSGDHAAALSKANDAANSEKAYKTAIDTLMRCESMHAQAKTQKALTDLLTSCEEVSMGVVESIDTETAVSAQVRLQQANVAMDQLQQEMAAVQEGFMPVEENDICISAGEEALAAIMAEYAPVPVPPVLVAPAAETEAPDKSAIEERMTERRKLLAELA